MINYCIEPASEQDIDRLCEIECACFSTPWDRSSLMELISNRTKYHCLVASGTETNRRIVFGYVGLLYVLDEGEIVNIAVHPDWAGQGIGYALIGAAKAFCRTKGIDTIHLEVRTGNASAIALYRKCGFMQTGLRRGYYADTGEDALLFACKVQ